MPLSQNPAGIDLVNNTLYVELELDSQARSSQDGAARTTSPQIRASQGWEEFCDSDIQEPPMESTQTEEFTGSFVEDTQYKDLELDTQPPPDPKDASQHKFQQAQILPQNHDQRHGSEAQPHLSQSSPGKSQIAHIMSQEFDSRRLVDEASRQFLEAPKAQFKEQAEPKLSQGHSQKPVAVFDPKAPATYQSEAVHMTSPGHGQVLVSPHVQSGAMLAESEPAGHRPSYESTRNFDAPFSRSAIPEPLPETKFTFQKAAKFNTENLTRIFPTETGALVRVLSDSAVVTLADDPKQAPQNSGSGVSDEASTVQSRTGPQATVASLSGISIIQTEEISERASQPSAAKSHSPVTAPSIQPYLGSTEVLAPPNAVPSTQNIRSAARDSVKSGDVPASTNTSSTEKSTRKALRRPQCFPFNGFFPEEESPTQVGSSTMNTTATNIEPTMAPTVHFRTQEASKPHMPSVVESTHNESHKAKPSDEPKLSVIASCTEERPASRNDRGIDAAAEKDNGDCGGSRTDQGQALPVPAAAKPHHRTVAPSLAAFDGSRENLYSDSVSTPRHHPAPKFVQKTPQPNVHSTARLAHPVRNFAVPRMSRAKSGRKGTDKQDALRHPASSKQPDRHSHDLPPLSRDLIRDPPFPDQKVAPRGRDRPDHSLHQSARASIPANPLPAGNSANDGRRRTPTTAPSLSRNSQQPDRHDRADTIMHNTKEQAFQQVLLAQSEAARHEIKTGIPHVPNEQSNTRSESAWSDSPHPTAFVAVSFPGGELSSRKYIDCDVDIHKNHGSHPHGRLPSSENLIQIEADMESVHVQHPSKHYQGQFDYHSEQSRPEQTCVRSLNEGNILEKPQLNLSNDPHQHPQSHARATSRDHNTRSVYDRHSEQGHLSQRGSSRDVSEDIVISQDLEKGFQPPPPLAGEPSRRQNEREIGDHESHSEQQQEDEHQPQQQLMSSRSSSRRSNVSIAISSRPMRAENLQKARKSTPALGVQNAPKIQKSISGSKEWFNERLANAKEEAKATEAKQQEILQNIFVLSLEQMEAQKNEELENERNAHTKTKKTVADLEVEKSKHLERIARFQNASHEYRDHMNHVVRSQKFLTADSARLKDSIAEIRTEAATEAKQVRVMLAEHSKQKKVLEKLNKEKDNLRKDLLAKNLELAQEVEKLNKSKESLQISEAELRHKLELEATKAQGLKNQIEDTNKGRQEFAKILKEIPGSVANELVEKDGILAKLLSSQGSTQSKVDEVIALVTSSKDATAEFSPTLKKAIEDFFTKLENKLPSPSTNQIDPAAQVVDDLKAHFDAAMSVLKVQDELKNQITKIEKTNTALKSANEAQTTQLEGMTSKIEELQQTLDATKREFEKKKSEFETLRANPPENPQLANNLRDLHSRYNAAQEKINAAAQDTAKDKQELKNLRESIAGQKKEVERLDLKIKSMNEDKAKNEEAHNLASQKLREEYQKAQLESHIALKQEHQAELKNWEQKQADVESALNQSREETQKVHKEHNKTLSELDKFKEFVTEAEAQLQRAEEKRPCIEDSNKLRNQVQAVQEKLSTAQKNLQNLSEKIAKQEEFNSQRYQDFVEQLKYVDELERLNVALARQNLTLGEQVSGSRGHGTKRTTGSNASSTHPTPTREPAEQQEKSQPTLRTESRPALRKPSASTQAQSQGHVPWAPRASGALITSPNMTPTAKRSEKGVTFSSELSYSQTPPLVSSPANSETAVPVSSLTNAAARRFFDEEGELIVGLLPEYFNLVNRCRREEANQSSHDPSRTLTTFSRNDKAIGSSVTTTRVQEGSRSRDEASQSTIAFWRENDGSSTTAVTFSKSSKEEASQGQQKSLRGVLKANSNSAPIVEQVHTPQAIRIKHNPSVGEGLFSGGSASSRPPTAKGHSRLIEGHRPTYQPENQESPHQGSSGRYTNLEKSNGQKRSAPPGKDKRPQKRRAVPSQTRSRSQSLQRS